MNLRIAIPKGRLFDKIMALLYSNFKVKSRSRDYRVYFPDDNIVGKIFKPRAIPQLLAMKKYDIGFCGFDLMKEYWLSVGFQTSSQIRRLRFDEVRLIVAMPSSYPKDFIQKPPKRPLIIATEYPHIANAWAIKKGLAHIVLQTWGSTEGYAPEEADIIIDCCETGQTLAVNGLKEIETLLHSSTCIFSNCPDKPEVIRFLKRIESCG